MSIDEHDVGGDLSRLRLAVRRATEETEQEADAMFAQYQLSQLIAFGGSPRGLAESILGELAILCGATEAFCWLADLGGERLYLAGRLGDATSEPPSVGSTAELLDWVRANAPGVQLDLQDKDGPAGLIALRASSGPLDPSGIRVAGLIRHELAVAFRNTQLRAALEEERRAVTAVIESATDAIIEFQPDGQVWHLNPAAQQLFGRSMEQTRQTSCAELFGCDVLASHAKGACPVVGAGLRRQPIEYLETPVLGAAGYPVRVSGSLSPIMDGGGTVTGITAILQDVEARAALGELRESFVATVSHELRTPLALIRGYAESLRLLQLSDERRQHYAERIESQIDRLTAMIHEILEISHLDAGSVILDTATVGIETLVEELRRALPAADANRLTVDVPQDLPALQADPYRVGQVLRNLVENAVKYGPPNGTVRIGAGHDDAWVEVWVEDDGPGIPVGDRRSVTEPFHRGRAQRESNIPGYGLGLHIARRLIEAHGGRLQLMDRPDGHTGTRASFFLRQATGGLAAGPADGSR